MGALLSAPIAMIGSCAGSLVASCCATAACRAAGFGCIASSRAASITYIVLLTITVIAALGFGNGGGDIVIGGTYNSTADSWLTEMRDKAMGTVSGGGTRRNAPSHCPAAHSPPAAHPTQANRCGTRASGAHLATRTAGSSAARTCALAHSPSTDSPSSSPHSSVPWRCSRSAPQVYIYAHR